MKYDEFKSNFCKLFGYNFLENEGSNYFTDSILLNGESSDKHLHEKDLQDYFEKLDNYSYEEATMYNEKTMEIILNDENQTSLIYFFEENKSWSLEDTQNNIFYKISFISPEMLLFMIKFTIEKVYSTKEQKNTDAALVKFMRNMKINSRRRGRTEDESGDISLIDYLLKLVGRRYVSLKISSNDKRSFESFVGLKNSYLFNTMYLTNRSLIEHIEFDSILFPTRERLERSKQQLEIAPLKSYNANIINYYKKAMSSSDPYIQYISFYHILEYFYDETYYRYLVNDMRGKITHPDFSYKSDEELIKLAKFAQNRLRQFGEDGQGNELESLKYVLKEFVNIPDLKTKLEELKGDWVSYYSNHKVTFSDGPVLNFKDDQAMGSIAKRIYYTRNSLIHSKSGKKELTYHPYNHENLLKQEIPLIKKISEMIIIMSAEML